MNSASATLPVALRLQQETAIRAGDEPGEMQAAILQQPRVTADRRAAGAIQRAEQRALGGRHRLRLRILDRGQQLAQLHIVAAHGDADNALAGGRHHLLRARAPRWLCRPGPDAAARHKRAAWRRSSPASILARRVPTLPRRSANSQVGPRMLQLRLAAHRGGADLRPLLQRGERVGGIDRRMARRQHQRIARILALQRAGERDAGRQSGFQILQAMHGEIDPPRRQRFVDFLGEQPLAADLGERAVLHRVAGGDDDMLLEHRPHVPQHGAEMFQAGQGRLRSGHGPAASRACRL